MCSCKGNAISYSRVCSPGVGLIRFCLSICLAGAHLVSDPVYHLEERCSAFCTEGVITAPWFSPVSVPEGCLCVPWKSICLAWQSLSAWGQEGRSWKGLMLKCSWGDPDPSSDLPISSEVEHSEHCSKILSVLPFYENWIYKKHFFFVSVHTKLLLSSFLLCEKLSELLLFIKHRILLFWFGRKRPSMVHEKGSHTFSDKDSPK